MLMLLLVLLPLLEILGPCIGMLQQLSIIFALPVPLLRQVSHWGLVVIFFRFFFTSFLSIDFDTIFLGFWRGLGGQLDSQNRLLESFLQGFFDTLILE